MARRIVLGVLLGILAVGALTWWAGEQTEVARLRTRAADGSLHETKLWVVDHAGHAWVRVANPRRGWLARLREQPRVELLRAGRAQACEARVHEEPRSARGDRCGVSRALWARGLVVWRAAASRRDPGRAGAGDPGGRALIYAGPVHRGGLIPMRDTLRAGLMHSFCYRVPADKTVPALYPEAPEFQLMPRVFATGFLVGLVEWTCIQAVNPHLDWPREQTVGTRLDVAHSAPTPPGQEVTVEVELTAVDGRRLTFRVSARDDAARICEGTHERFVIDAEKFNARLAPRLGA